MKYGAIEINIINNELRLIKSNSYKFRVLISLFILPVFVIFSTTFLLRKQKSNVHLPTEFIYMALLIIVIVLILTIIVLDMLRSFKKTKNHNLKISRDGLLIKDHFYSYLNEIKEVFIQPVTGWKGLGETFTLGILTSGKKKKCLAYDLSKEDAIEIAKNISNFLNVKHIIRDTIIFSLFKGY